MRAGRYRPAAALPLMALGLLAAGAVRAAEGAIAVPSGQDVRFLETIENVEGTAGVTWRFRFVAPAISRNGGSVANDAALADMDALCAGFVLPRLEARGEWPDQVVISLADRPVPFGMPDPDATQYFEAYRIENGTCIWEGF